MTTLAAPLTARMVHRNRPLLLAPPSAFGRTTPVAAATPAASDALRFFLTCYAAGLIFFAVMLS